MLSATLEPAGTVGSEDAGCDHRSTVRGLRWFCRSVDAGCNHEAMECRLEMFLKDVDNNHGIF